eukprot:1525205-Alexandrium_andersonii.AAC.1
MQALEACDMDLFWKRWSEALYKTYDAVSAHEGQERDRTRRAHKHGTVAFVQCDAVQSWAKPVERVHDQGVVMHAHRSSRHVKQAHRLRFIADH